jgi:dTDP-4-dehydrorhamnose reductase
MDMATQGKGEFDSLLDSPGTLIIGRCGRLARALRHFFPRAIAIGRVGINIADDASVKRVVQEVRPSIVINCAAITDLPLCERDPAATRRINVEGVAHLATASREVGALLVHISSDYAAHPVNEYGRSKRDSESFGNLAIRAKIYDGSHWAWESLRCGRRIQMTTCEFSNPISTTGLATFLPRLLEKGFHGVVSLGSKDPLSLFEVGLIWADVLGASRQLVQPCGPVASPYPRPANTVMPVQELVAAGIPVPSLASDACDHCAYFADYASA